MTESEAQDFRMAILIIISKLALLTVMLSVGGVLGACAFASSVALTTIYFWSKS